MPPVKPAASGQATLLDDSAAGSKRRVDDRVRLLIENAATQKHRAVFLLVGDRGKEQLVTLHAMASRANFSAKLSVLWCMKGDPVFVSTSRRRMEKQSRMEIKAGMASEQSKETFDSFLQQTDIKYAQYKDSHRVLGKTFGMAILQDFEALTPNILARTVETVAGGGIVVVMLRAMSSLRQLYTMTMDVHSRYRKEGSGSAAVVPRFNERFLLSLCDCGSMLCVDDDLNVLPVTTGIRDMASRLKGKAFESDATLRLQGRRKHEAALSDLKAKLAGSAEVGPLVGACSTVDQAKTVLGLMQAVIEKTLSATCAVTAGRGRGKSAALGLAVAGALLQGYSNIFVTAPSPDNVSTLFEFAAKGLTAAGLAERKEFDVMLSTNKDFAKCVVRLELRGRGHRQTVQFIDPQDTARFAQAELLVIDEAAALPLPLVKAIMGPYLIFFASTVSGYEGTGRSLSMKLIAEMRQRCGAAASGTADGRTLKELSLADPIRYGPADPVEGWLTKLLCLDATKAAPPPTRVPHPDACTLYHVSRDALFSYHPTAETALQQMIALFVAAHYKNQPNDLQLLSDAPGHHLFVLCGPLPADGGLPALLCAVHCAEEGHVAAERIASDLSKGSRPSGDLIPYTIAQQYTETGFAKLSGVRVVRIATHPDLQRSGYGRRALSLVVDYFGGAIATTGAVGGVADRDDGGEVEAAGGAADQLTVAARQQIPTLLQPLHERPAEPVDYVGVSFGLTAPLLAFWQRAGFHPLYVRQAANELTGEHSAIMARPLSPAANLSLLRSEFHRRFVSLLGFSFRRLPLDVALAVALDGAQDASHVAKAVAAPGEDGEPCTAFGVPQAGAADIAAAFTAADLRRLSLFSTSYVDTSTVLDLVPLVARMYFARRLFRAADGGEGVELSLTQAAMLLAIGLQHKAVDDVVRDEAGAPSSPFRGVAPQQMRAFFHKAMARVAAHLGRVHAGEGAAAAAADELEEKPLLDAAGNVVGLTVARREEAAIETDQTLFRDARGNSGGAAGKSEPAPQRRRPREGGDSRGKGKGRRTQ